MFLSLMAFYYHHQSFTHLNIASESDLSLCYICFFPYQSLLNLQIFFQWPSFFIQSPQLSLGYKLDTVICSSNSHGSSPTDTLGSQLSQSIISILGSFSSQSFLPITAIPQSISLGIAKSSSFPLPFMLLVSHIQSKSVSKYSSQKKSQQMRMSSSGFDSTPTASRIWSYSLLCYPSAYAPKMTGCPLRMCFFIHFRNSQCWGCLTSLSHYSQVRPNLLRVQAAFSPMRIQEPAVFLTCSALKQCPKWSPTDWMAVYPQYPWWFFHCRRGGILIIFLPIMYRFYNFICIIQTFFTITKINMLQQLHIQLYSIHYVIGPHRHQTRRCRRRQRRQDLPTHQLHPRPLPHRVRPHRLRQLRRYRQSRWQNGQPRPLGYRRTIIIQQAQATCLSPLRRLPHRILCSRALVICECTKEMVPITNRKRRKCAQDLCRKQGRLEGGVSADQEGPQRGTNSKGNRPQDH